MKWLPQTVQIALSRLRPDLRLPPQYRRADLLSDLWAGLTVGALIVPQAMAYALLAGVPPQMGLYTSFASLLVYALFGSSRQLIVGPVTIMSLLVYAGASGLVPAGSPQFTATVAYLSFFTGLILLLFGLLHFGPLAHFISKPVIGGFTTAAALIIMGSQLKYLSGISLPATNYLPTVLTAFVNQWREVHLPTLLMTVVCIGGMISLRRWQPKLPAGLSVVVLATVVVYWLQLDRTGVDVVGTVPRGLPPLVLPPTDLALWGRLLPTALTLAFVSFALSISTAQALALRNQYKVDPDQELVGLGLAGLAAGLVSGYPPAGSFFASATNDAAGARSSVASVVAGALVLTALLALTAAFYYLPHAALATVIIVGVFNLLNFREPRRLFQLRPADGWTWLITFVATLFLRIEVGVLTGIGFSLLLFIWRSARPHLAELGYLEGRHCFRDVTRYPEAHTFEQGIIIRVDARLYFANLGFVEEAIQRLSQGPEVAWVALDLSGVNEIDTQALDMLGELLESYEQQRLNLYLVSMKGPVRDLVARAGWRPELEANIFVSLPQLLQYLELGTETKFVPNCNCHEGECSDNNHD